jgi:hypothetical protein
MQMLYGLQWTDTVTGETTLCEVEAHVVYECGSKLRMGLAAIKHTGFSKQEGWPSRYRAVPLPFTGPAPDWANI